jgi:hypothetical protein
MVTAWLMVLENGLRLLDSGGVFIVNTCRELAKNLEVEVAGKGHR